MRAGVSKAIVVVMAAVVLTGCGASRAYTRGQRAAHAQQWDEAVEYYRQALLGAPDKPEYKIALERAMQEAAGAHLARARALEAAGQPDEALRVPQGHRVRPLEPVGGGPGRRTRPRTA